MIYGIVAVVIPVPTRKPKPILLRVCPKCKTHIPAASKFCPECGANLIADDTLTKTESLRK